MYKLIRSVLFLIDAEKAHHIGMKGMSLLHKILPIKWFKSLFNVSPHQVPINIESLNMPNFIGLAAGLDKNAKYFRALHALGFGHIEVGTITPRPQPGNPKPRLFRIIGDKAIINRMGFNNDGVHAIKKRLQTKPKDIVVGANIGKNKDTPNENAINDYVICFTELYEVADYFVVNVSSPNTPNLRALQDKEPLTNILNALQQKNFLKKPLFLKIAPDLTTEQLDEIIEVVLQTKITGIIATNTTITREGLNISKAEIENIGAGGLSGSPLFKKSIEVIKYLRKKLPADILIIGVGGIDNADKAQQMINAGVCAIQLYTGFIYQGPKLISEIINKVKV